MMSHIDNDKLGALVGKMLGDLGGAFSVPTVRIGFRMGLFEALHRHGPARIPNSPRGPDYSTAMYMNGHSLRLPTVISPSMRSKDGSA